jgi:serine/threonine protein kinase
MTLNEIHRNSVVELHPGTMITENVRLVRQIGEGGMASVWLAHHVGLDTQVAVKLMSPALACHQAAVERFTREARSAARIHHPNVVQILDYGVPKEGAGLPYIVMEYLEGTDLETRIHLRGRLTLEETASIVIQTARALEKAHELSIVHRDIKPENIFLTADGEDLYVKVLDFGIAKLLGRGDVSVTNTGATLGTPTYMSPEQMLSAKNVDYKCDLWALAIVAYESLTGRKPFAGETYGAVCLAVNRGKFRLPSRYRRDVPVALDEWFMRSLSRDTKKRYRSAREMGEAFIVALGGDARTTPSWRSSLMASYVSRHSNPKRKRTRVVPYVAVGALAAGALLAVTFAHPWWRAPVNTASASQPVMELGPQTAPDEPAQAQEPVADDSANAAQPAAQNVEVPPPPQAAPAPPPVMHAVAKGDDAKTPARGRPASKKAPSVTVTDPADGTASGEETVEELDSEPSSGVRAETSTGPGA